MEISEDVKQQAQALLGLVESLDGKPVRKSTRDSMSFIHKSLQALEHVLWPREAYTQSPVPDKVLFRFVTTDATKELLFQNRADGIYFEGERIDHTRLTEESVQKLVLNKLTAFYGNVAST